MSLKQLPNVAIFVDVQNIYYTTKQTYRRQFNYRRFWALISESANIVSATAYAIESHDDGQKKFQTALKHIGFDVKLKPYIQRSDGSAKGDWDVGITLDVVDTAKVNLKADAQMIDQVILLSGDGDFDLLLKNIKLNYGVKSCVYGVPSLTAASLIQAADIFYPINTDLLL